jgi:glycosyltransferase involved in cell wall biosynthesis
MTQALHTLVVSERLSPGMDDGIKNIALNLMAQFRAQGPVVGLSEWADVPELGVVKIESNRWYTSPAMRRQVAEWRPSRIVYVPWTSATLRSLARLRFLKLWSGGARTAIVASQPMPYAAWQRPLLPLVKPDLAVALSEETEQVLLDAGFPTWRMTMGVDATKFRAAQPGEREALREAWGLPRDTFLITHVGHLKRERFRVKLLAELATLPGVTVMVLGSPHTPAEEDTVAEARAAGVVVRRELVEDVSAIYRMSDLYLFPVRNPFACVGVPLSVIEALACGCPVLSTPFQALPDLLPDKLGSIRYAATDEEMPALVQEFQRGGSCVDREGVVARFSWDGVARDLLEKLA